jgi:peptide/nickel transport system permease protein
VFLYLVRRILIMVPLLFVVCFTVFLLLFFVPGDPAITLAGDNASAEQIEAIRENLGLNDPFFTQFWNWISDVLVGDLGTSLYSNRSVADAIGERLPVSVALTAASMVVALAIAIPAGLLAAARRGSRFDRVAMLFAGLGVAIPNFWLGTLLILVFALHWNLFPAVGYSPPSDGLVEWVKSLVLPAITLGSSAAAETTRQLRGSMITTLENDYVRTARSVGVRDRTILIKHALKNASIPAITVIGFQVAFLLGGSAVVERVFALPGIGDLAINAVIQRDFPMVQGIVIVTALIILTVNLVVDLLYAWLDPRVRRATT